MEDEKGLGKEEEEGGREGEARGRGEGEAWEGGLGSPPSRIPLIPMLSGGNDLGVGAFERSASAEKGEALGGATCAGGFVVRSTVRSDGCWC